MTSILKSFVLKGLALLFVWSSHSTARASASTSSVVLHLGEAFSPNHFRLNLKTFDIGYDGKGGGLYSGKRLWKGNTYGGAGFWVGFSNDFGLYGMLGMDWTAFGFLLTSFEFYSVGTVMGSTYAIAQLGVGFEW